MIKDLFIVSIVVFFVVVVGIKIYETENVGCPNEYQEGDVIHHVVGIAGVITSCDTWSVTVHTGVDKIMWTLEHVIEFQPDYDK